MEENKKSYYINIQTHEIVIDPYQTEWDFKIEATDRQIAEIRHLFDENYETDWESYARAHVPFLEYHHDPQNKEYDLRLMIIYAILYQLGDAKTREHIEEMGILESDMLNSLNSNFN